MSFVIVVPCFNEARRWDSAYWRRAALLPEVRWVLVDDGSSDSTWQILESVRPLGAVETIRLPANKGKAEAVRLGLAKVLRDPELALIGVGFLDADGAFSLEDVQRLLDGFCQRVGQSPGLDALWSSRVALAGRDIRRSLLRHYIGRIIATFVSFGTPGIPYDTQSGFKLFRADALLLSCLEERFETRWLFELELLVRWQRHTGYPMRIWEEPVNYWHDVPGSRITYREVLRIAHELVTVKRIQLRSRKTEENASDL